MGFIRNLIYLSLQYKITLPRNCTLLITWLVITYSLYYYSAYKSILKILLERRLKLIIFAPKEFMIEIDHKIIIFNEIM